jgi:uncharacterized membrane protein YeaQ/YmgE (transglycosylase-associated protein family)
MISAVQNCSVVPMRVSFKANEEKGLPVSENYSTYKTHAGVKTGTVFAALSAGSSLLIASLANKIFKSGKEIMQEIGSAADVKNMEQASKSLGKIGYTLPIAAAVYIGCGALIDMFINKKRAKFDAENLGKDKQEILKNNPDSETTRSGEVYLRTNVGKKYGTILGAVVCPILNAVTSAITKTKSKTGIIGGIVMGALGGLMLGAITDRYSNKGAEKHADKKPIEVK